MFLCSSIHVLHVFSKLILILFFSLPFMYFLYNQTNQNSKLTSNNNQHTPTKIENPEINIHQQSNPKTDLHIQKF